MPDYIRYDTKNDRELLIVLAESFNSLNEKTTTLCKQSEELYSIAHANKDKIREHELKLIEVTTANALICKDTTNTLKSMNDLLVLHTSKLSDIKPVVNYWEPNKITDIEIILRWWKLFVSMVTSVIIAIIIYLVTHNIFKGG